MGVTPAMWRDAGGPRGAHALYEALATPDRYEHARGVAQQAARTARAVRLPPDERGRLLATAWVHDIGYALDDGFHPVTGARALRRAGHERMARLVAHHSGAAVRAGLLGLPSVEREFPVPTGPDRGLLDLLDVADLLTGSHGERIDPATRLRNLVARKGPDAPSVRALVQSVTRLGAQPDTRRLIEILAPDMVGT